MANLQSMRHLHSGQPKASRFDIFDYAIFAAFIATLAIIYITSANGSLGKLLHKLAIAFAHLTS